MLQANFCFLQSNNDFGVLWSNYFSRTIRHDLHYMEQRVKQNILMFESVFLIKYFSASILMRHTEFIREV